MTLMWLILGGVVGGVGALCLIIRSIGAAVREARSIRARRMEQVDRSFDSYADTALDLFRPRPLPYRPAARGREWDHRRPLPRRYASEPVGAPLTAAEAAAIAEIEAGWREDAA